MYLDHGQPLPKLEESNKGLEVNVSGENMTCTYELWRAKNKIYAEAMYFKSVSEYMYVRVVCILSAYYILKYSKYIRYTHLND